MSQPTTSPISGLHHFAVSVKGLPDSIAWYQKVFQATLAEGTLPHYGRDLDKMQLEFVAIDA